MSAADQFQTESWSDGLILRSELKSSLLPDDSAERVLHHEFCNMPLHSLTNDRFFANAK